MPALRFTRKTTPEIINTRMADDTHPVFTRACAATRYGGATGRRVTPDMPDDIGVKTQVVAAQGLLGLSCPRRASTRVARDTP